MIFKSDDSSLFTYKALVILEIVEDGVTWTVRDDQA